MPQSKANSKELVRNIPSYMYQKTNFTPVKHDRKTMANPARVPRKINSRGQELPNIIDNVLGSS